MSKFNITISVPSEALPSILTELPVFCAELVSVEQQHAAPPSKPAKARDGDADAPSYRRATSLSEVYAVSKELYQTTQSPFTTSAVWHTLQGRGTDATPETVSTHLAVLRSMNVLTLVGGNRGPGGYLNIVSRHLTKDELMAEYREHADA